jgi:hypothetical protein
VLRTAMSRPESKDMHFSRQKEQNSTTAFLSTPALRKAQLECHGSYVSLMPFSCII